MSAEEHFEEDFSDDPVLVKIDKKIRSIFALIQEHTGYSMLFYVAKDVEDGIRTYSGAIGNIDDLVTAVSVDCEQAKERGQTTLYEAVLDMLLEVVADETPSKENAIDSGRILH
jgi:predicted dinucleotide-utilizing enzyme